MKANHDAVVLLFLASAAITGWHKSFVEYGDLYWETSSRMSYWITVLVVGERKLLLLK